MQAIRRFLFKRSEDVSGISGTGVVGEGVEFTNGKVVMCWLSSVSSLGLFDNMKELELIHGHEGRGIIEWIDDKEKQPESVKCEECEGTGSWFDASHSANRTCLNCGGSGKIKK